MATPTSPHSGSPASRTGDALLQQFALSTADGLASTSTLAVVGARVAALEAELRAKDAALQASKLQTSQWSAGCTQLRQQLLEAEEASMRAGERQAAELAQARGSSISFEAAAAETERLLRAELASARSAAATAEAAATEVERYLRADLAIARATAARAEDTIRALRAELAASLGERASFQHSAEEAESRLEAMVSVVDSVRHEVAQATALPEAALQAAAAAAGRVTAAAASRSEASCLRLLLWLWSAQVRAATAHRQIGSLRIEAAEVTSELSSLRTEVAMTVNLRAEAAAATSELSRLRTEAAAAASSSTPAAAPCTCRTAVVRLLGGAVGRYWRAQRKLVLELWRGWARSAGQQRRLEAEWAQRRVFDLVVHTLLGATQDAWWLHTIVGSWKNLVCAQVLERVFAVVAADGPGGMGKSRPTPVYTDRSMN